MDPFILHKAHNRSLNVQIPNGAQSAYGMFLSYVGCHPSFGFCGVSTEVACWHRLVHRLTMKGEQPIVFPSSEFSRLEILIPPLLATGVNGEKSFALKLLERAGVESERGANKDPMLQLVKLDLLFSFEPFVDFFLLLLIRGFSSKWNVDSIERVVICVPQTIIFGLHVGLHGVLHHLHHLEVHVTGEVGHVELVPNILVLLPLAEQEVDCLC